MKNKNDNVQNKMSNWEEQSKMSSQQNLRNQQEKMLKQYKNSDKDTYAKNENNKRHNLSFDNSNVYRSSDDLTNKNSYMEYELNNTFDDKDEDNFENRIDSYNNTKNRFNDNKQSRK